jgi:hypothetical protein
MKCDILENKLIDYLYGELSQEERESVRQHIDECEDCRKELASLKQSRFLLNKLPVEPPPLPLTGLAEQPVHELSIKERILQLIPHSMPGRLALAAASFLLLFILAGSFAHLKLEWNQQSFVISMGTQEKAANAQLSDKEKTALINQIQQQDLQIMQTLVNTTRKQDAQFYKQMFDEYAYAIQERQSEQMKALADHINAYYMNTNSRLQLTDKALDNLIQTIQYKN